MSYEFIRVDIKDHITTVTINRPEVMNALHPYAQREMNEVFDADLRNVAAAMASHRHAGADAKAEEVAEAAQLPRHPTGKLYKRLLRDEYWAKEKAD